MSGTNGPMTPDELLLTAEIRRLRGRLHEVENEREEARGLAREYLYTLRGMDPRDVSITHLEKDVERHPWLLEPEPTTATGVAESQFG